MANPKTTAARRRSTDISVADVKKHLSECLARVAFGGEILVITRRGRPMARLVQAGTADANDPPAGIQGWLEDDDPFFDIVDEIVARRATRLPRALAGKTSGNRRRAGA